MTKIICGRNEDCFEDGTTCWGHLGGIMCLYLSETVDGSALCYKKQDIVQTYFTASEYEDLLK